MCDNVGYLSMACELVPSTHAVDIVRALYSKYNISTVDIMTDNVLTLTKADIQLYWDVKNRYYDEIFEEGLLYSNFTVAQSV